MVAHSDSEAIAKFEEAHPAIVMFGVQSDSTEMIDLYSHITQNPDWSLRPAVIVSGEPVSQKKLVQNQRGQSARY